MEYDKLVKKYIEKQGYVNCCVCGKEVYPYDEFIWSENKKYYVFVHKDCLKLRG